MSTIAVEEIHIRLRVELERLSLSLAEASRLLGEKDSQGLRDVCSGRKRATADLLSRLEQLGVDVLYVLTGRRAPAGNGYATAEPGPAGNLSLAELGLIKSWRQLDAKGRQAVLAMMEALTQGAPSQVFNGPVENIAGRDVRHVNTGDVKQGKGGRIG